MLKASKKYILYLLILSVFFTTITVNSYAAGDIETLIQVGYFEYWQDPSTHKWLYDDATGRHTMQAPAGQIKRVYTTDITLTQGYSLLDVKQYAPDGVYENKRKITAVPDDAIRENSVEQMKFENKNNLIGKEGKITLKFRLTIDHSKSMSYYKEGIKVYRLYLPFAFVCKAAPPIPVISLKNGTIFKIGETINLKPNQKIELYGDKSYFPASAKHKYFWWQYKKANIGEEAQQTITKEFEENMTSEWKAITKGENKTVITFTAKEAGEYIFRLGVGCDY